MTQAPASFAGLLGNAALNGEAWSIPIPDSWLQGRTAYGGFSSALAVEAARRVLPDLPPLRSAQFSMIAPLSGQVEARARVVREGRNAIWVTAELVTEKGTGFLANCVFMQPRESALAISDHSMPDGIAPVAQAPVLSTTHLPAFMQEHFDVRIALPHDSLQGADLCWWVRLRERDGLSPDVEAVLVGDALPPAVLPGLPVGTPVSSMQWHVNMLGTQASDSDGWWLIRSTSREARNGLASEAIHQWASDGTPAIAGIQSVAVFG